MISEDTVKKLRDDFATWEKRSKAADSIEAGVVFGTMILFCDVITGALPVRDFQDVTAAMKKAVLRKIELNKRRDTGDSP